MKLEWLNFNNERILFADFSNLVPSDMINLQDKLFTEVQNSNGKVKILSNYAETSISAKFVEVSTDWAKKTKSKTDRYAVFGLNAPKRIMLNSFNAVTNMGIKAFESREEALAYLVE